MKFKAVIWDMDGLLIDTERLSHESWLEAARILGVSIPDATFRSIIGMNELSFRNHLNALIGNRIDVPQLVRLADEVYHGKIDHGVPLKPGAKTCIEWLHENAIPQAVATSSRQSLAQKKLGHHELLPYFTAVVSGDQISQGKPHPEIFATAAHRMNVHPSDCLAFEDSRHGVEAASRSGAHVILVPDIALHDDESRGLAAEIWDSLEQGPSAFERWLGKAQ